VIPSQIASSLLPRCCVFLGICSTACGVHAHRKWGSYTSPMFQNTNDDSSRGNRSLMVSIFRLVFPCVDKPVFHRCWYSGTGFAGANVLILAGATGVSPFFVYESSWGNQGLFHFVPITGHIFRTLHCPTIVALSSRYSLDVVV
jgi:hypothetical protein